MYVCMYVCMHVYMYAYMYVCVFNPKRIFINGYMGVEHML